MHGARVLNAAHREEIVLVAVLLAELRKEILRLVGELVLGNEARLAALLILRLLLALQLQRGQPRVGKLHAEVLAERLLLFVLFFDAFLPSRVPFAADVIQRLLVRGIVRVDVVCHTDRPPLLNARNSLPRYIVGALIGAPIPSLNLYIGNFRKNLNRKLRAAEKI